MAFRRYANAVVTHPHATQTGWEKVRRAGGANMPRVASMSKDLVAQATDILKGQLNPDRYLLSHATIVCSVDTDPTPNVRLGKVEEGGQTVNRRWGNYLITPNCSKYVNNNGDAWSRPVLMKAYRTFIGAHNFLEHVQVEDLSKGRIIDAVARDVGESLYVDILVATDRKHTDLISDIESGKLSAMSMGCNVEHTTCTKCGNVAVDDTEMCEHVRYQKLNKYFDTTGKQRIIAELCGHETEDPTGGVTFIEASWVANPAFTGAVMRNILSPTEVSPDMVRQAHRVLAAPPRKWVTGAGTRSATVRHADAPIFNFNESGGEAEKPSGEDEAPADTKTPEPAEPAKPKNDLGDAADRLYKEMLEEVEGRVRDTLKNKKKPTPEDSSMAPNENVNKEASARIAAHRMYASAVHAIVTTASNNIDVVNRVASLDRSIGIDVPVKIYRVALNVGPIHRYKSETDYISVCATVLNRRPTQPEANALVRIGRILNHAEAHLRTARSTR